MGGKAAYAVPTNFAKLGRLTQLQTLQLRCVGVDASREQLKAALLPLTGLTQLHLGFADDPFYRAEAMPAFPWEATVCGLTLLQELHVTSDTSDRDKMLKGMLSGALSRLTALRRFEILGMQECGDTDHSNELQLAALPALERAALQLYTRRSHYPGLGNVQQLLLSRIVSLSLALRYDSEIDEPYVDTHLPTLIAPALTELILDDLQLAPDSEQLRWLPGLPKLRRLVLKDVRTNLHQVPQGIMASSGLTELVLAGLLVGCGNLRDRHHLLEVRLRSLPAGPALSKLVRLSLSGNAISTVPPCLADATALEVLDMAKQRLGKCGFGDHGELVHGLHVLGGLKRLRNVNLVGFNMSKADFYNFHAAHPGMKLTW